LEVNGQLHAPAASNLPGRRASSTHWLKGWVGYRTGLDTVAKKKIPSPCRESNPGHADGIIYISLGCYIVSHFVDTCTHSDNVYFLLQELV